MRYKTPSYVTQLFSYFEAKLTTTYSPPSLLSINTTLQWIRYLTAQPFTFPRVFWWNLNKRGMQKQCLTTIFENWTCFLTQFWSNDGRTHLITLITNGDSFSVLHYISLWVVILLCKSRWGDIKRYLISSTWEIKLTSNWILQIKHYKTPWMELSYPEMSMLWYLCL